MRSKKHIIFTLLFIGVILFHRSISAQETCCEYTLGEEGFGFIAPGSRYSQLAEDAPRCANLTKEECDKKNASQFFEKKTCNVKTMRCECPEKKTCLELQVGFPGSKTIEDAAYNKQFSDILAKYIVIIFQFLVWAAISLAIFMIMVAGFMWLISAGNQGMITKAKGFITNALYGLIVVLTSYIILQTINPELVRLKMPKINAPTAVTKVGDQCCYNTSTYDVKAGIELIKGQKCQDVFGFLGGTWTECPGDIKKYMAETKSCCRCSYFAKVPIADWKLNEMHIACSNNPESSDACTNGSFLGRFLNSGWMSYFGGSAWTSFFGYSCDYIADSKKCVVEQTCREAK